MLVMTPAGRTMALALWTLHTALAGALETANEAGSGKAVFRDVAASVGIDFTHANGMTGALFFPEMTGQGCALLDYDNDGDLDVYLVQGGPLDPAARASSELLTDLLFRSRLAGAELTFDDVSTDVGLTATGYGMGVATGDYDDDGWIDIYLTNYGPNQLLRNRGGESFVDVTSAAGVAGDAWSTGASFVDLDRDGDLDLYVVNYVEFSVAKNPVCYAPSSRRDYCGPSAFTPQADRLYRNRGDGRFDEVAFGGSLAARSGAGLGVVSLDADGDGWLDLYVANDGMSNFLWLNSGDDGFHDEALLSGVAVNRQGSPEASMGVEAADVDNDGDEDLFVAHLEGETNTLYINQGAGHGAGQGGGLFDDRTLETGLGHPSLPYTGFGAALLDYDLDGWLDLAIANGAVKSIEAQLQSGETLPLRLKNQLFRNTASGYEESTEDAGDGFDTHIEVSRGLAVGDVDNDGDPDLLMVNNAGRARLLLNDAGDGQPWLGLRLLGPSGRDQLGAWVGVHRRSGPSLWRRVRTDGSYASARDPRLRFGLGEDAEVLGVEVVWPDGRRSGFEPPPLDRYTVLRHADVGGGTKR